MERQAPQAYPCASPLQIIESTSVARSTTTTSGESDSLDRSPAYLSIGCFPLLRAAQGSSGQAPHLEKEEATGYPL